MQMFSIIYNVLGAALISFDAAIIYGMYALTVQIATYWYADVAAILAIFIISGVVQDLRQKHMRRQQKP